MGWQVFETINAGTIEVSSEARNSRDHLKTLIETKDVPLSL